MTIGTLILIILLSVFIIFPIWFLTITYGIVMCKRNNSWGLLLLLLSTNIFGLLIGWIILFNNNHVKIDYKYKLLFAVKENKSNLELWKEEKNKLSKRIEFLDKKINNKNYTK